MYDSALSDFLIGNTGHIDGPRRFDMRPWTTKLRTAIGGLTMDLVKVEKPCRMMSQFRPLRNCPSLRGVNISIFGEKESSIR